MWKLSNISHESDKSDLRNSVLRIWLSDAFYLVFLIGDSQESKNKVVDVVSAVDQSQTVAKTLM